MLKIKQETLKKKNYRMSSKKKSLTRRKSHKPCKSNQVRNPDTGRCKQRKSIKMSKSKSVNRKSVNRKSVKRKSVKKSRCISHKPYKSTQVRNFETNRCVKRTGKIGQEILNKRYIPDIPKTVSLT